MALEENPPTDSDAAADRTGPRERRAGAVLPASASRSLLPPFLSPRGLTLCVAGGLVLFALVAWLAVGVHLAHLRQLQLQLSGTALGALPLRQVMTMIGIAQGVQVGVFGVTALAFLAWLYRLRANLRALGVRKLDFARHWSVLGFLIPAVNFVLPYQVWRRCGARAIRRSSIHSSGGPSSRRGSSRCGGEAS